MQLSEEEKQKQQAISESIEKNQRLEDLTDKKETGNEHSEVTKIKDHTRAGIVLGPKFTIPEEKNMQKGACSEKKEQNSSNEQNEHPAMGLMGDIAAPKPPPIVRIFKKIFGKKD